ncbi:MAG: hypothetical protein XD74_1478 [Actinobacteria bacterium 66_15]|nr:MAG: hypothetical protein XD74_1478 [Actinobacteria bacterium 66_15]
MAETQHISLFNLLHRQNSPNTAPENVPELSQQEAVSQAYAVPKRLHMSLPEGENTFMVGTSSLGDLPRDRHGFDRQQLMADCLDAWRFNPLARRIVELTSQYVTGGGMAPRCPHAATQAFLRDFWTHPLNRMDSRLVELSDELARSGNLFLLLSADTSGMSYLRVVPSADIERIESRTNDVEQEVAYFTRPDAEGAVTRYPAFALWQGTPDLQPVMLHYAINRPAGAQWGEPDLAPILRWLSRYAAWLEDRVRLNRFRNAFMYVVKARFTSESARSARQLQLVANPPAPGSVLVTDENEEWSVLSPHLEALDASSDGLAIKKMIAAGAGLPLHFLAEPESSTRTTAEAADTATLRRFEQRQRFMQWMIADLLRAVVTRRALVDPRVDPQAEIRILAGDISARDNQSLAEAGSKVAEVAQVLYAQGLIDQDEMLRLIYRFLGEGGNHVEE